MTRSHFLPDDRPLVLSHACAAILRDRAGLYLLQERDDIPGIWYPGHFALFGGAIEAGETPLAALRRELVEEIGIALDADRFEPSLRLDIDLAGIGPRERHVYAATLEPAEIAALRLGEGAAMRWIDARSVLASPPRADHVRRRRTVRVRSAAASGKPISPVGRRPPDR
jgi:8-oxo-dGTP pyrophosphatase MutT (NUDIX family)